MPFGVTVGPEPYCFAGPSDRRGRKVYCGSNMAPIIWVPVSVRRGMREVCGVRLISHAFIERCLISPSPLLLWGVCGVAVRVTKESPPCHE